MYMYMYIYIYIYIYIIMKRMCPPGYHQIALWQLMQLDR